MRLNRTSKCTNWFILTVAKKIFRNKTNPMGPLPQAPHKIMTAKAGDGSHELNAYVGSEDVLIVHRS